MKTYDIKTLFDFCDVPEDRLDACMDDFRDFIGFCRAVKESELQGDYIKAIKEMGFQWVDDGKVGIVGFVVEQESESEAGE